MKKNLCLICIILLLFLALSSSLCFAVSAIEVQCADALYEIGLFTGTGVNSDGSPIYSLDRVPTRSEAITMLVRLLGKENEAKSKEWQTPFTDLADWVKPYVGYAYNNGLTNGTSLTTFGGDQTTDAKQYLTFVLRALGYDDSKGDFVWNESYKLANTLGICSGEYDNEDTFLRGNIVILSYKAIKTQMKSRTCTLLEYLYNTKAITKKNIADVNFNQSLIDFNTILSNVNSQRNITSSNNISTRSFQNYLQHKSGEVSISKSELDSLLNSSNNGKSTLNYSEASYDIDLYFRALKYGYGGYYYFGDTQFSAAKDQVLSLLQGKTSISKQDLTSALQSALSFVHDGHFTIDRISPADNESVRCEYYYSNFDFTKENNTYYTIIGGERWYYSSCNNENVEMDLFLNSSGNISYRLIQFCPTTKAHTMDLVSLTSNDRKKSITVTWSLSTAYDKNSAVDYNYLSKNGIAYVSVRRFSSEKDTSALTQYIKDAKSLKDAKLIIYDLRYNTGGSSSYSSEWVKNLTGQEPQYSGVFAKWNNYLWNYLGGRFGREAWQYYSKQAVVISNDIPIIILVDDLCASSGELALLDAKTINNSIVIGSNSNGCLLCGNVQSFYLPNSGIEMSFSQGIQFINEIKNIDGIGIEPDIWCNPSDSLESVLNMLVNYNLADSSTVNALKRDINHK